MSASSPLLPFWLYWILAGVAAVVGAWWWASVHKPRHESYCAPSPDQLHSDAWFDGGACSYCGAPPLRREERMAQGMEPDNPSAQFLAATRRAADAAIQAAREGNTTGAGKP